MRLGDLAKADPSLDVPGGVESLEIAGLTADSRAVRPGFLFAALKGEKADGRRFAAEAVAKGAAAVLTDKAPLELAAPVLASPDPRRSLALLAARLHPRQPERLVAVTGTSGKTSVAVFLRQIFQAAGHEAASIGTIGVVTSERAEYGTLTTPDPVELHRTLDRLAGEGVTHAALEASSHGLDQRRLDGLRIQAAGFTNLGRDHMDYHPTVEAYLAAKLRLFDVILPKDGTAVVNADSDVARAVLDVAGRRGQRLIRVGRSGAELRLVALASEAAGQRLRLDALGHRHEVLLPLAGTFQAENALVAAGLAIAAGVDPLVALEALEGLRGAPGRLERVGETLEGAQIFVDYAHKPDAIAAALQALRPFTRGRLIVLFGAGGDRDPGKRRLMGEAAVKNADLVIVTDDNPRSEEPAAIRQAILEGAPGATEIGDRGEAIRRAIALLRAGDVLCVAGKGHETGQIIGGTVHPFSDHAVIAEALAGRVAA